MSPPPASPLARQRLNKAETRSALRNFNVSVVFRALYDTTCAGNTLVFVSFALALGIAPESMGYVATAIGGAIILQLVALPLLHRVPDKKRFILRVATLEPLLLVGVVLGAPLLPAAWRFPCFAAALFLATGAAHVVRPLTDEWLASTIPARIRGTYTGLRLQLGAATVAVGTLLVGWLVDVVGRQNHTGLAGILSVGAACGVLAVYFLRANTMPALSAQAAVTLRDWRELSRNRPFRRLLLFYVLFDLPFFFTVPYSQVYALEILQMSALHIGFMMAAYHIVKVLLLSLAGRAVDRYGPRLAVLVISPLYAAFFILLAVATVGRDWSVYPAWILAGIGDSVFSIAVVIALYRVLPDSAARPAYFAIYNVLTIGLYALAGMLAVPLLHALRGQSLPLWGRDFSHFHLFFLAAGLLMIPCTLSSLLLPGRRTRRDAQPKPTAAD